MSKRLNNASDSDSNDELPQKKIPRTLDNTRAPELTFLDPEDDKIAELDALDEFAPYFAGRIQPKVLVTSTFQPSLLTRQFLNEFSELVKGSYYKRVSRRETVTEVCNMASTNGFTDVVIVSDARKQPYLFTHIHLPSGPTAVYRLTNYMPRKKVPNHGKPTDHSPEVNMSHFTTRLGHRVSRMLHCLFPVDSDNAGRQVATFHNQRDFIFFRYFRYIFDIEGNVDSTKTRMQELGPRFTLKLRWIQRGLFDPVNGEFEFKRDTAPDAKNRRRFFL
ncbi:hypothetical protein GEMRC1_005464 [Eukaryota sp. GEM-RC1]